MKENKFRVYCEFEFDGKLHKSMESPASWFLMTQTGKLWVFDPLEAPRPLEKEYKKAIPLFYTGRKDNNEKELYFDDIIQRYVGGMKLEKVAIKSLDDLIQLINEITESGINFEIIGNIYENPELLRVA